jgi:hypothetical protein
MAIWLISGRLGSGKGKYAVKKIREYLAQGRRVATNMDVYLDKLMLPRSKKTCVRIPDYPTVHDLEAIGHGNPESYDEERNGLIVVDELAKFMNARSFQDKGRKEVIDWLVESRKKGWDVMFQAQAGLQIDKQVREALVEYLVTCYRLDRVRIPFGVGLVLETLTFGKLSGRLPRMHMANIRLAAGGQGAMVLERDMYRGDDLHHAYDTRQQFRDWSEPVWQAKDSRIGPHSLLSAWHLVGRHQAERAPWWRRLTDAQRPARPVPRSPAIDAYPSLKRLPPDVAWALWKARAEGKPLPRPGELLALARAPVGL